MCTLSLFSRVRLFATPWTVACQTPLSMGFSRQEYWSGLPFPSPGDLPEPGIEPRFLALQADSLPTELQRKPRLFSVSTFINYFSWIFYITCCSFWASALPASLCTFMLWRWLLSFNFMDQPLLTSNIPSVASSPLSAFIESNRVGALLWIRL